MGSTTIGQGLTIEGEVISSEDIFVAGIVRGKLSSEGSVSVDSGSTVQANITANSLSVAGNVTGDVHVTDRVDLLSGGRLLGDLKAARFTIADGASFKGNVDMDV